MLVDTYLRHGVVCSDGGGGGGGGGGDGGSGEDDGGGGEGDGGSNISRLTHHARSRLRENAVPWENRS